MQTKIYPAIDIIDGNCVRLMKGDYDTMKVYGSNPLEMALSLKQAGAEYLHVVDLDAAKNPEINNRKIIAEIIRHSGLKVQTGGGIRSQQDVDVLLEIGADRLIVGSVAVTKKPEVFEWIKQYGGDKIVIGSDVLDGKIATHGWLNITDEDIFSFIKSYIDHGANTFLCTDITKDGMLEGASVSLYQQILTAFPGIYLIASGGVHDMDEVQKLRTMQMESIIIGKAIYEGKILVESLFN
ncbi:MAG: 1-(5-phosphoribosyl)-5-[(5-phosphoribosylamino)methylideneamino]imidazole-4-carboxamide isomerase [Saprospiraceae bacterium]|nr:1-(5-phosphoribosyl)-5-[(5-phosphoribosylamino)methylideneamino]imidazole-4-carboxamide isomerase [Saprospiraceae bacterium]MBP6565951.1 1-(5-phosphoribosyl)-5-[(5-phosphoribosylamino)methylideneamino]imidazole-4-carboxamide isomerase [Saprospiraceae bacterium]